MTLGQILIEVFLFGGFALFGRWLQLHPEKVVPEGTFARPHTFGARCFRVLLAAVGSFATFGGTMATLNVLLSPLSGRWKTLELVGMAITASVGIFAAIRVRKEVRAKVVYEPRGPYGAWP